MNVRSFCHVKRRSVFALLTLSSAFTALASRASIPSRIPTALTGGEPRLDDRLVRGAHGDGSIKRDTLEIGVRVLFHNSVGEEGVWTTAMDGLVPGTCK